MFEYNNVKDEVLIALGHWDDAYDVDGIVSEIRDKVHAGFVNEDTGKLVDYDTFAGADDIPLGDFWELVEKHALSWEVTDGSLRRGPRRSDGSYDWETSGGDVARFEHESDARMAYEELVEGLERHFDVEMSCRGNPVLMKDQGYFAELDKVTRGMAPGRPARGCPRGSTGPPPPRRA